MASSGSSAHKGLLAAKGDAEVADARGVDASGDDGVVVAPLHDLPGRLTAGVLEGILTGSCVAHLELDHARRLRRVVGYGGHVEPTQPALKVRPRPQPISMRLTGITRLRP